MTERVTDKKLLEELHNHFVTLVNKHKTMDRLARDFGHGTPLIGSEIHMIEAIGERSMVNVTEVAHALGITKAAASQTVAKIHKSGYVRKLTDEKNKREVLLTLTEIGQQAYDGHKKEWDWSCETFLNDVTEQQIEDFNFVAKRVINAISYQIEKNQ